MKSLKRISKIQTKIKTVLTQMISVGVVAIIGLFLIEATASGFSGSGSGTPADPYQITNATQLQEMADDLDAHYVLVKDIDASETVNWNGGAGFEPIGDPSNKFTGTFDGQNHTIDGLYISRGGENYVGLFGYISNSVEIKNVGLINFYVNGLHNIGGLAGLNYGTISNSYSNGSAVTGYPGGTIGGLVGQNGGTITNSYSTASATGHERVGGLVGYNVGTITNSYATGIVTGYGRTGGLVGENGGTLTNSFATGKVICTCEWCGYVGGLVGLNYLGTITNSYASADGSIFYNSSHPVYTGSPAWNFVNIWGIDEGVSYPYLLLQIADTNPPEIICPEDITVERESGDGTVVEFECTATDNVDPDPIVICDPPSGSTFPLATTTVTCTATDASDNSSTCTFTVTVVDTTPPQVEITFPTAGLALQDVVTLTAVADDWSGVSDVYFYVREPDGGDGIPIGCEDLPATWNGTTELWEFDFDTTGLLDGYYVILATAVDTQGNEGWSEVVPFSIRNWAVMELLTASKSNKAGRTMPVKFSLRIAESVDAMMPFVYNEELEITIYDAADPDTILQTSLYGDTSKDYRIDIVDELYITNFKTKKQPAEYVVEIWRASENFLIGSFTFETVR